MSPSESEAARTRLLLAAWGLGAVALAAVAAMLVLGLPRTGVEEEVVVPSSTATASTDRARERARWTVARSSTARGQLFARTSFWNKQLSATTPLDPNSTALVQALVAEVQRERTAGIGPWIALGSGSTPLYRAGPKHPRIRVRLERRGLRGGKALERAFASVPIPSDAKTPAGSDKHMTVWQPSTDTLWEFFGARRGTDGWKARWGGAIRRVSKSRGYYTAAAWPGATRNWGATASSLPVIGGTMLLDELKTGRFDHALAINLPAPRAGVFAWPAQRTDGTGPPTALPEGARLRLDPALNLAEFTLPRLTRMIAVAAQRYGLVVRDQTHHAISLFGEDYPSQLTGNPYRRYLLGRTPGELLAYFPWDRLQVLEMHLCTRAPCEPG